MSDSNNDLTFDEIKIICVALFMMYLFIRLPDLVFEFKYYITEVLGMTGIFWYAIRTAEKAAKK